MYRITHNANAIGARRFYTDTHAGSSLGPRASRPHRARSASRTSAVEPVARSARLTALLTALPAGETPAVPVKSLSHLSRCSRNQALLNGQSLGFAQRPAFTGLFSMYETALRKCSAFRIYRSKYSSIQN